MLAISINLQQKCQFSWFLVPAHGSLWKHLHQVPGQCVGQDSSRPYSRGSAGCAAGAARSKLLYLKGAFLPGNPDCGTHLSRDQDLGQVEGRAVKYTLGSGCVVRTGGWLGGDSSILS